MLVDLASWEKSSMGIFFPFLTLLTDLSSSFYLITITMEIAVFLSHWSLLKSFFFICLMACNQNAYISVVLCNHDK